MTSKLHFAHFTICYVIKLSHCITGKTHNPIHKNLICTIILKKLHQFNAYCLFNSTYQKAQQSLNLLIKKTFETFKKIIGFLAQFTLLSSCYKILYSLDEKGH